MKNIICFFQQLKKRENGTLGHHFIQLSVSYAPLILRWITVVKFRNEDEIAVSAGRKRFSDSCAFSIY